MLRYIYNKFFTKSQKHKIKGKYLRINRLITDRLFSYNSEKLKRAFRELGIERGDTILVHSSFNFFNGFQGNPQDVIYCLINLLGENGNLLMVSLPYESSSYEYLRKGPVFDVRSTPSKMGILSEIFRRKEGVFRSLHPTHPLLAFGKDAAWIVEGHHKCLYPCGKDTPFDKFRSRNGKVLFFDVPFGTFTFIHYIEDEIKDMLPFQLYRNEPMTARVLGYNGDEFIVKTFTFGDFAVKNRNPSVLEDFLLKKKMLKKVRIGKTKLMLVSAEDAVECAWKMTEQNLYFYNNVPKN